MTLFSHLGGTLALGAVLGGRSFLGRLSGFFGPLTRGSKLDPSSHAASRLGDAVTTEIRDSPSDPTGLEDGS